MQEEDNKNIDIFNFLKEFCKKNKLFSILVIIFSALAILNIFFAFRKDSPAGIIGDSSALLNTIFSGLAFLLLIYTASMQKEELSLQRKELKQTREELEKQKEQFQIQNDTLKRQRFENTFFNMLSHLENIVNNVEHGKRKNIDYEKGRRVFEKVYSTYFDRSLKNDMNNVFSIEEVREVYNKHIFDIQIFENYFVYLYRIMKFVDETNFLNEEEKSNYIDILRATLSPYELIVLFYNGLCHDKMKRLIEKYIFLDNLRIELLANINHLLFYDKQSYSEELQNHYEEAAKYFKKIDDNLCSKTEH